MHIIAADVGGTKTRLVFSDSKEPINVLYEARYSSGEFDGFESLLKTFIHDSGTSGTQIDALTLALPGLVDGDSARLTNLPWVIEKQALKDSFGINHVSFMNDFQASAFGTGQLLEEDRIILNPGQLKKNAVRVAVGAGTGLGVAWVLGDEKTACAYDTEGGHIDFAPIDDEQIRLLQFLQKRYAHVSYERLLSGAGLVNIYEFCAGKQGAEISAEWVNRQSKNIESADRALSLFVQIYGAYIGNIALIFKPYGGIFITGGVAAKMLQKMQSKSFINAYLNKGRMSTLVEQIPVYLVTNERIGVLGAMSEAAKIQRV
jgi:glucokinase